MNKSTGLLFAGLAVGAFYLLRLDTAGNTVQLVFTGVTANSALSYNLTFMIQNVANAQINLNSLAGTVSINDNIVGNISDFPNPPIAIPANSQQQLIVNFQPSLLGLAADIASEIQNPTKTLSFAVSGNMNVNGLVLPFSVVQTMTV